jgi:predicted Zn-dependent protease with MMP-like domain
MNEIEFEAAVLAAYETLPGWVVAKIENLTIETAEQPHPWQQLLGLYEGVPLTERDKGYFGVMPDRITIYRLPHMTLGLGSEALRAEIRVTVLHEVAHHLGIDDTRLRELGWA